MLTKDILAYGKAVTIACDGLCNKAWGIQVRPRAQLSEDEDDYALLADGELGEAPADPGTYEGDSAKPTCKEVRLNKWCFRQCERSSFTPIGEPIELRDFSKRRQNIPDESRAKMGYPPVETA